MLDTEQLCSHLVHLSHLSLRRYGQAGRLECAYAEQPDAPDPLRSDPDFAARLLAEADAALPRLHFELDAGVYGILCAPGQGTFVLGPGCLLPQSRDLGRQIARLHGMDPGIPFRVPCCTLEFFLSVLAMLCHHLTGVCLRWTEILARSGQREALEWQVGEKADQVCQGYREEGKLHNPYSQEEREQESIRRGDVQALRRSFEENYRGEVGTLARDPLRQTKNIAITLIALSSRSAIAGGVPSEIAYSLSDAYVQQLEGLGRVEEAAALARQAELHYAALVREHLDGVEKNALVTRCKEQIETRLHQKITVAGLAGELGVTPNYLSQQFRRQEGLPLADYIRRRKVQASLQALRYTRDSYGEIAYRLGFSSQSHFGQAFKKVMGITPGQYRSRYQP